MRIDIESSLRLQMNPKILLEKFNEGWIASNPLNGARLKLPDFSLRFIESFSTPATLKSVLSLPEFNAGVDLDFLEAIIRNGYLLPADNVPLNLVYPRVGLLSVPLIDFKEFSSLNPGSVDVAFLGLCYERGGTGEKGTHFAPRFMRQTTLRLPWRINTIENRLQGLYDMSLQCYTWRNAGIWDLGDIDSQPCAAQGFSKIEYFRSVSAGVRRILDKEALPVIIGGDHSLTYAVIAAYEDFAPVGILHFDAHADLESGPLEPTEIGMCSHGNFMHFVEAFPHVVSIIQIGQREIRSSPPFHFEKVKRLSSDKCLSYPSDGFLEQLPIDIRYYITIDVDVLDPLFLPNTGTPVPGGLSIESLSRILKLICKNREIIGFDVMELIPSHSLPQTGLALSHLIYSVVSAILETKKRNFRL